MAEETAAITIGADAVCREGICGKVTRVVVDPVAHVVTHLVVTPNPGGGPDRLVPLDRVEAEHGQVHLRLSLAEFEALDPAVETEFLPGTRRHVDYTPEQTLLWPYYGLGGMLGALGPGAAGGGMIEHGEPPHVVRHESIPVGEVAVRRGEAVYATDGQVGRVKGLVIDPKSHGVTHVLLQEGHLWGRRQVAIPIQKVTHVGDTVQVSLTRAEIEQLPPVELEEES